MDTEALGRALGTVGNNLGTWANYQASEQRFQEQQTILDRREAAQNAFREHLQTLSQDNSNKLHDKELAQNEDHFTRTQGDKDADRAINQQRADTADTRVGQQLDLEKQRISLEASRVAKEGARTSDAAAREERHDNLAHYDRQVAKAQDIMRGADQMEDKEAQAYMKSNAYLMETNDAARQATLAKIHNKYESIRSNAKSQAMKYSQLSDQLTGDTDDTTSPDTEAAAAAGSMPKPNAATPPPTSDDTGGDAAPTPAAATAPSMAQPPQFHEGQRIQGPDGKIYVITNGKPVPEGM